MRDSLVCWVPQKFDRSRAPVTAITHPVTAFPLLAASIDPADSESVRGGAGGAVAVLSLSSLLAGVGSELTNRELAAVRAKDAAIETSEVGTTTNAITTNSHNSPGRAFVSISLACRIDQSNRFGVGSWWRQWNGGGALVLVAAQRGIRPVHVGNH